MITRPVVITTRATERERNVIEAAAKLEQASLAETVRRYAVAGAVETLRTVEPEDDDGAEQ